MNGYSWRALFVRPDDPMLVDRTGTLTVATTDPDTRMVYISNAIHGKLLEKVLIHELGHCAILSYGLLDDIHKACYPEFWIDAEEWVCNFIADYGYSVYKSAYDILGPNALSLVPYEIERLVA